MMASGPDCTVSPVLPLTEPSAAVMVVPPASPAVPTPAALIVATAVFDDVQVTWLVRSRVPASEYTPVAVNCCVLPTVIVGLLGVTWIVVSVDAITLTRSEEHTSELQSL